jgi:four helix bundle protein
MAIKSYRDLAIWQKAIHLAKEVYDATSTLPLDEKYGLSVQVKRSVISIAANITEGHGRGGQKEFLRYLNIAYASLAETETHLILAHELSMISSLTLEMLLERSAKLGRMINGMKRSIIENTDNRQLATDY